MKELEALAHAISANPRLSRCPSILEALSALKLRIASVLAPPSESYLTMHVDIGLTAESVRKDVHTVGNLSLLFSMQAGEWVVNAHVGLNKTIADIRCPGPEPRTGWIEVRGNLDSRRYRVQFETQRQRNGYAADVFLDRKCVLAALTNNDLLTRSFWFE